MTTTFKMMSMLQFSPGGFKAKTAEPEATLEIFDKYVVQMQRVFRLNRRTNPVTGDRVDFTDAEKKDIMLLEGGVDMEDLFKHVGKVQEGDTYAQAVDKIKEALRKRGSRSAAVYKLFSKNPQGSTSFDEWHRVVYEGAKRIDWTGYEAETAAVDAMIMQTSSQKLREKALQESPSYQEMVKLGIGQEQARIKAGVMPESETAEATRALQEEVRKLKQQIRVSKGQGEEVKRERCKNCMLDRCRGGDKCPAKEKTCNKCDGVGHFARSPKCPKKTGGKDKEATKVRVKKVEEVSDDDVSVGMVDMVVAGVENGEDRIRVEVRMRGLKERNEGHLATFLTDTGVKKTIMNIRDWRKIRKECELEATSIRFRPYGTAHNLPIIGKAKMKLKAVNGAEIETYCYINDDAKEESLLGESDAMRLGIIEINAQGAEEEIQINRVRQNRKREMEQDGKQLTLADQKRVDEVMNKIAEDNKEVFQGIGRYRGKPIKIQVKEGVRPVIQPARRIPLHLRQPLKDHLEELVEQGVVEGPLAEEEEGTWVSNLVLTGKKWDTGDKKPGERIQIRANLDCRPLNKVVYQPHEPIPTPEELRHELLGSDRFSCLDMTHCFHQFPIEEEDRKLFTFRTPWGLYRYKRMVMGNSPASAECHKRVRQMMEGIPGVLQIKDDVLVHGKGQDHDESLRKVLARFQEWGCTLRRDKCKLGKPQVTWFGHVFSRTGMLTDPEKVAIIQAWERPRTVKEVKSFLQTVQFNRIYMAAETSEEMSYSELTAPLRDLTKKKTKFSWTANLEEKFKEIKRRLCSDRVMVPYDLGRRTRLYTDAGPEGTQATLTQAYEHPREGTVWRPVTHTSHSWTEPESRYSQIEKESNGIYWGVMQNKMYLLGTEFEVMVDHHPLLPLYNSEGRPTQARVDRHKTKLAQFNFTVGYVPGLENPCDYGSRHPGQSCGEDEEDSEYYVNRLVEDHLPGAITRKMLRRETAADPQLKLLMEDIERGECRNALHQFSKIFRELTVVDGIVVRGSQLIIPKNLQAEVIQLAHEGHLGQEKTLGMLRQTVWFPNISGLVKEFVQTCKPCLAAQPRTGTEPLKPTMLPQGPWQHLHCDFKGPVGGSWYLHIVIDQYSKFPEVEVVKSTSWEDLRPSMERILACHGIPEILTTDGGPPYAGEGFNRFCRNMGIEHKTTTPEDAQANGFAEAFVKLMCKMIHTAVVEGRDPKKAINSYLLAYRAAPHLTTGKSPAEMLYNRQMKTKLPRMLQEGKVDKATRERHDREKLKQKEQADKRRHAKEKHINPGDEIMIQRKKTSLKTPWDPDTYRVTEVNGSQVKAERRGQKRIRAKNLVKVVKERPPHLQVKEKKYTVWEELDLDMDMDKIRRDIQSELQDQAGKAKETQQAHDQAEEKGDSSFDSDDYQYYQPEPEESTRPEMGSVESEDIGLPADEGTEEGRKTRSGRVTKTPLKLREDLGYQRLSPRDRKRRQVQAKKLRKKQSVEKVM